MTASPRVRLIDDPRRDPMAETVEGWLAGLGGPSVLRVPGRDRRRARGFATLLHGNEPSGVRALHAWLRSRAVPGVDLVCFVGAVAAALAPPRFAHRLLPGRSDLNRCFRPPFDGPNGEIAGEALRLLREAGCDALVDLHNNTGHNPPYGVATAVDAARLQLTALFGERLIVSDLRLGTLTEATSEDFPSLTVECGRAGDPAADRVAREGLERYAALDEIETRRLPALPIAILGEAVRVCARSDVSRDWFVLRDGLLATRRAAIPIMMTVDAAVARSDCLFYLVLPRKERV